MTRLAPVVLTLAALVAGSPVAADAHALLRKASPAVGSTLKTAPVELSIVFSEAVEPAFSSIVVRDGGGTEMQTGVAHAAAGNVKLLAVGLKPLPAGTFAVVWHVTSVDTHKTEGKYSFTVAP
jgi:copper resistance protein C